MQRYIYSGTHAKGRQQLLDDFRAGLFPVLVNCAILTEGADIPNIDCVVVARPTRSRKYLHKWSIVPKIIWVLYFTHSHADRSWNASLTPTGKEDCQHP